MYIGDVDGWQLTIINICRRAGCYRLSLAKKSASPITGKTQNNQQQAETAKQKNNKTKERQKQQHRQVKDSKTTGNLRFLQNDCFKISGCFVGI